MKFSIIVATDKNRGIGKNNDLPWPHLPGDMKHFREVTTRVTDPAKRNVVLMGRKTWESIPEAHRPLKGRINVVLTRNADYEVDEEVLLADSFENGLKVLEMEEIEKIFVVGGGSLYAHTIENPDCEAIYITEIDQTFDCDTFFPEVPEGFEKKALSEPIEEKGIKFQFFVYNKSS